MSCAVCFMCRGRHWSRAMLRATMDTFRHRTRSLTCVLYSATVYVSVQTALHYPVCDVAINMQTISRLHELTCTSTTHKHVYQ